MAWVKIPKEHHPLFLAALPRDPDVEVLTMFGGIAAMVNGNMAGGLFGRSMMVKLAPADLHDALALEGASVFDPMGNGRVMKDTAMLPDDIMEHPDQMRVWLGMAIAFTRTLPPKLKNIDMKKTARIPAFAVNDDTDVGTAKVPLSSVKAQQPKKAKAKKAKPKKAKPKKAKPKKAKPKKAKAKKAKPKKRR